ncbi:hypothetical protein SAMN05421730_100227 [Anaerobium acetethylicum]|uniref:Uncharacterized protein n=1 Tax=Anaerobium acetethylicum TaxID=1619234 RepID=A0A1D3TQ01_9FIRM|nr:hypothetical protein SAMN05421730_100227 [Anaerobium acetethylicum]
MGAGRSALPAAYAVEAVWVLVNRNVHGTCRLADFAFRAFGTVQFIAVKGNGVEEAVDCPKRTEISAERPVYDDGKHNQCNQDHTFPCKEPANDGAYFWIDDSKGPAPHQCPRGADIFAEPWIGSPVSIYRKQGKQDYKNGQNEVFDQSEVSVSRKFADFFYKGYLMQQVLKKAEGAEPSAYEPAQKGSYSQKEPDYVEGELASPVIQGCLKGAYRTGAEGPRAGVAVEPRKTGGFQISRIDFAFQEADEVPVAESSESCLYPQPPVLNKLMK